MKILELLDRLNELDFRLWVSKGELKFEAPEPALSDTLRRKIESHKKQLVKILNDVSVTSPAEFHLARLVSSKLEPSSAQRRLLFLDQLLREQGRGLTAVYNNPLLFRIKGYLDVQALWKSLNEIVRRHLVLRTTFVNDGGYQFQKICKPHPVVLQIKDLEEEDLDGAYLLDLIRDDMAKPFDLQADIMMRGFIFRARKRNDSFLLLVLHHIASDGWSMELLTKELLQLYTIFSKGQTAALPPVPSQYINFCVEEKAWRSGKDFARQLNYWLRQLDGIKPLSNFPTDHPRPLNQSFRSGEITFTLSAPMSRKLRAFAKKEEVTLFMVLLAAFKVLLLRYSGEQDLVVGTPIANRDRREFSNTIGFFVNMLVLRSQVSPQMKFRELLGAVKKMTLSAYQASNIPFEYLVEKMHPTRSFSYSPLFQILFSLQIPDTGAMQMEGAIWESIPITNQLSPFDLAMNLRSTENGIHGGIQYALDLFNENTVHRLVGHFQTILKHIIDFPQTKVCQIPMLCKEEYNLYLKKWNGVATSFPESGLVDAIAKITSTMPDALAVICGTDQLTYINLNKKANRVARHLKGLKVGPGHLVGVCMKRSVNLIVGLLGILKTGAAYMPLDPDYPEERLCYMLNDSETTLVLSNDSCADAICKSSAKTICIDIDIVLDSDLDDSNLNETYSDEHLAYVIYTSGSSGTPKGVQVTMRNMMNILFDMRTRLSVSSSDIMLAITTISFDISNLEIFLPLISGATLVIATEDVSRDGDSLAGLIKNSNCTIMQATPSTWRMLLYVGWQRPPKLTVLCGGEALSSDLMNFLNKNEQELWNVYGPTETTIWSTAGKLKGQKAPITIGSPVANTKVYVLDESLEVVPAGVVGNLYIGGRGVTRGYQNRPDLCAERFVPDPFSSGDGERMYRTGDLGRHLANGEIEFMGRSDDQVKLRGFRIELKEIERCIEEDESVHQAVVTMVGEESNKSLTAFVVPRDGCHSGMDFSLFYFSANPDDKSPLYQFYFDTAMWADVAGFKAIWTPERHFHVVGGQFPNPALLSAALAKVTKQIRLRAGSIVSPLHHPIRIVEEWGMVDNLSNGRVDVAIAPGWNSRDFSFFPERYENRHRIVEAQINEIRRVWGGEAVFATDGTGKGCNVVCFPRPVQKDLKVWLTTGGTIQSFERAGRLNVNILTHLIGQSINDLERKISIYRKTLEECGHLAAQRTVTLMLHTFVWPNDVEALHICRGPMLEYLKSHLSLQNLAESISQPSLENINENELVALAFERYVRGASLIGDMSACSKLIRLLKRIGVDEIACLIDFGVDQKLVQQSLVHLGELHRQSQSLPSVNCALIREKLRRKLPEFMIPASISICESFPHTANGKIDRKALTEREACSWKEERTGRAPLSEVELTLAGLWQGVLKTEVRSVSENFFAAGGHSLLATQLISRIRHRFGVNFPLRAIFENPTIEGLTGQVIWLQKCGAHFEASAINPTPEAMEGPASHQHYWIWRREQSRRPSSLFNKCHVWELYGVIKPDILQTAVGQVVRRHAVLRTHVAIRNGQIVQKVGQPLPCEFTIIDLSYHSEDYARKIAKHHISEARQLRFTLHSGSLFAFKLIYMGFDRNLLVMARHTAIMDGWSVDLFIAELLECYDKLCKDPNSQIESVELQYLDFAIWQRKEAREQELQLDYWRQRLAPPPPPLKLCCRMDRTISPAYAVSEIPCTIDKSFTIALQNRAAEFGVTLFMFLLSAFKVVLAGYSDQLDIAVGTPVANRDRKEFEFMLGFFANILILRTPMRWDITFADLLKQVKEITLEAYANQQISFERVLDPEIVTKTESEPLCQVLFVLHNQPMRYKEKEGLRMTVVEIPNVVSAYDLCLSFRQMGNELQGGLEYNQSLYERESAEKLLRSWLCLLKRLISQDNTLENHWKAIADTAAIAH